MGQLGVIFFFIVVMAIGLFVAGHDFSKFVLFPPVATPAPAANTPASPKRNVAIRSGGQTIAPRAPALISPASSTPALPVRTPFGGTVADVPRGIDPRTLFLSPYYQQVKIGTFAPWEISLYANFSGGTSIPVTGWTLRSSKGWLFVPGAVNAYDPSGSVEQGDILLKPGDAVRMSLGESPIGRNFRLNACIGYLANVYVFSPGLPWNCPRPYPTSSLYYSFSGRCQDYISSLWGCQLPDSEPNVPKADRACREYLRTINYESCYRRHQGEAGFLGAEVRVWIKENLFLPRDEVHDRILLLDTDGLVVDWRTY